MLSQVHVYIKGDVTGVGFRAWVRIQAKESNVTGWIRNVYNDADRFGPHGGVEAVLQGEKQGIDDVIDHIKNGSTISRVDDVDVLHEDPVETFNTFEVLKSESYSLV